MNISRKLKVAALVAVAVLTAQPAFAGVTLNGSGSTFASPLISSCKTAWQSANDNATINYSGGGSGTGRTNTDKGIGNFAFSDASYKPLKSSVLQIPIIAAPVAIAYNIDPATNAKGIYLSQKTLSHIFLGKVTKWNDQEIVADNTGKKKVVTFKKDSKGKVIKVNGKPVVASTFTTTSRVSLPDKAITVVFRSDTSGTTQNLANFFIAQFPSEWSNASSSAFSSVIPGGVPLGFQGASGSAGVAALAANTPGSITYVESSFATANKLGLASIQNAAGNYQAPTAAGTAAFLSSATAADNGALTFDYNTKDAGAYVLGIVSYALVDSDNTGDWAKATTSWLKYILSDKCVNTDPTLGYTTITGSLLAVDNKLLAKLPA